MEPTSAQIAVIVIGFCTVIVIFLLGLLAILTQNSKKLFTNCGLATCLHWLPLKNQSGKEYLTLGGRCKISPSIQGQRCISYVSARCARTNTTDGDIRAGITRPKWRKGTMRGKIK